MAFDTGYLTPLEHTLIAGTFDPPNPPANMYDGNIVSLAYASLSQNFGEAEIAFRLDLSAVNGPAEYIEFKRWVSHSNAGVDYLVKIWRQTSPTTRELLAQSALSAGDIISHPSVIIVTSQSTAWSHPAIGPIELSSIDLTDPDIRIGFRTSVSGLPIARWHEVQFRVVSEAEDPQPEEVNLPLLSAQVTFGGAGLRLIFAVEGQSPLGEEPQVGFGANPIVNVSGGIQGTASDYPLPYVTATHWGFLVDFSLDGVPAANFTVACAEELVRWLGGQPPGILATSEEVVEFNASWDPPDPEDPQGSPQLASQRECLLAQKMLAGNTSLLVVGDSTTNHTNGNLAGQFCYMPWGFLYEYDGPMCGLAISSTLGGTRPGNSSGTGINCSGGAPGVFVDDIQKALVLPSVPMADGALYPVLGQRAEFVVDTGEQPPIAGPHYMISVFDLSVPFPELGDWMAGKTARISLPVWRGLNGPSGGPGVVGSLWWAIYQDFDGNNSWTQVSVGNRNYASTIPHLERFDTGNFATGGPVTNQRVRLQIRGHVPAQGASYYEGRSIIFGSPWVWVEEEVESGLFIDCSPSIGGYTAALHLAHHPQQSWAEWIAVMPRPAEYALLWLGNNDDPVALGDTFKENLRSLGRRIIDAGAQSDIDVIPVIVIPPSVSESWHNNRSPVHRALAEDLRASEGWPVWDIPAAMGTWLTGSELVDTVHPSLSGALKVRDAIIQICINDANKCRQANPYPIILGASLPQVIFSKVIKASIVERDQ